MMDIFCSVQRMACISLSLSLPVCLYLSQLPLSQLLLSQSISCRDFTSLFTTYLPSAALPLIICTAFFILLDMHLSPSFFRCCFVFLRISLEFFFSPLGGLTSWHDFINANQSA